MTLPVKTDFTEHWASYHRAAALMKQAQVENPEQYLVKPPVPAISDYIGRIRCGDD